MATIYRKTPKGQHEIETRALRITPRFRSLLILVDGRRSDDELAQLMPAAGADALLALLEGGFIESIGETTPARPRPAPAATKPADVPASAATSLAQLRRELVRALTDQVGPAAEPLAIRIERASSASDLAALVDTAAAMVGHLRGRSAGDAFRQRFASGESKPPST